MRMSCMPIVHHKSLPNLDGNTHAVLSKLSISEGRDTPLPNKFGSFLKKSLIYKAF